MPIASYKPDASIPAHPNLPSIQTPSYKTTVYDDKVLPLASLISYMSGAPWTVTYYQQVVGLHNDLREIDPGQENTYQSYNKIVGMEFRVKGMLSTSYNNDEAITVVTGSSSIYPFLTPNMADYFTALTADNQLAIFRISDVGRDTFNRDSVHTVEYNLVGYAPDKSELMSDLETKTIKTVYFNKERLLEGLSPILNSEDYEKVINLKALYCETVAYYMSSFFNKRYGTLVVPGQHQIVYDHFLMDYLMKIVETTDAPEIRHVRMITNDDDECMGQPQFWELLRTKDYRGRNLCNDTMGLVSKFAFCGNSYVKGINFSNIDYVVYPDDPDDSTQLTTARPYQTIGMKEIVTTTGFKGRDFSQEDNMFSRAGRTNVLIHDVLVDDKYVLSEAFYGGADSQSILEILVRDYMQGSTIDLDMLYALTSTFRYWKRLEQFYYGPILMTLIQEANRSQY